MKIKNKFSILVLAFLSLALPLFAQPAPDIYGTARTIVVTPGKLFVGATLLYTNGPVDLRLVDGVAALTFCTVTNGAGGTITASVYGSQDQTNLTAISYALSTYTPVVYTNFWYNTNGIVATNNYLLPGTFGSASASTAGFAGNYLTAAPFTNTGAITLSLTSPTQIGFSASDVPRYLYVVYAPAGTATNITVSATLSAASRSGRLY